MFRVFFLVASLLFTSVANAGIRKEIPESYDDFQGIELALRLALDGRHRLAQKVIEAENPKESSALLLRVQGLLAEEAGDLRLAQKKMAQALEESTSPAQWIELGRVQVALEAWPSASKSFDKAGSEVLRSSEVALLALKAYRRAGQWILGWNLLQGLKSSGGLESAAVLTEALLLLRQMGLSIEAKDLILSRWAQNPQRVSSEAVALSEVFGAGSREAAEVLEAANLLPRDPNSTAEISAQLGRVLFSQGQTLSSAMVFQRLVAGDLSQAHPTSELFRLAGWRKESEQWAVLIPESQSRWVQQATLAVEAQRSPVMAALADSFDRRLATSASLSEQDWLYAIAFSKLETEGASGPKERGPLRYLSRITRPDLMDRVLEMRKVYEVCDQSQLPLCL